MNISPVFKFNDIVSQFMKSDQDSLIPFNFFLRGENSKGTMFPLLLS